jgi:hypothetical protein
MRLAEDRRARVPFAIVGVVLLVGSSSFAATTSLRGPAREDHATGVALDRTTASVQTALRVAVTRAAREAAANPVTVPANTSVGRSLNRSRPFRDALRVRIYLRARRALRTTRHRRGDVRAVASLPPPNETTLRAMKRRVGLTGLDDGTALRVTVRNVSVTARRGGRVVAAERRSPTVTVATPVLAAHDRTRTFERRLNRDALAGPGLGRRVTAWLYTSTWARGYAQYGGAPVENVLANRHVELGTNRGVLAVQRSVFGHRDPAGERAVRRAGVRVGAQDLLAPVAEADAAWTRRVLPDPNDVPDRSGEQTTARTGGARLHVGPPDRPSAPGPDRPFTVGVNHSADVAMARLVTGTGGPSLARTRRLAYRSQIRLRTETTRLSGGDRPAPDPPADECRLVDESVRRSTDVRTAPGPTPDAGPEARAFDSFSRRVAVHRSAVRHWRCGNRSAQSSAAWTVRYRVGVTVTGEYRPTAGAPDRPTTPVFSPGGALEGPNLADVADHADDVVARYGGPDAVAADVALGDVPDPVTIHGRRPVALRDWVYEDLTGLREELRDVTVTVEGGRLAAGRANVAAALARAIRHGRDGFVDAPRQYDGVADRARVAARAAYVDRLLAVLDARAARTRRTNERYAATLRDAGTSPERISGLTAAADSVSPPADPSAVGGEVGPAVALVADGAPTYLTLTRVRGERLPAVPEGARYHPLVARNTNLFTVPYGDVADTVVGGLLPDRATVSLSTAGRALRAANRTAAMQSDPALDRRRAELALAVGDGVAEVRRRAGAAVDRETALGPRESNAAVAAALRRWNGTGSRALAAGDGRLAPAVVDVVADRAALSPTDRDRLGVAVRVAVGRAIRSEESRVPQRLTDRTVTRMRSLGRRALTASLESAGANATERASDRVAGEALGGVPAGLPVAPVPGYWYATVNVWTVAVEGEFARFAVTTDAGAPGRSLRYVRDGSVVTLDVDGDGRAERLGRNERVEFAVDTTVAVAVPPNGRGVGDVDGDADERSAGWAHPGCARTESGDCRVGGVS